MNKGRDFIISTANALIYKNKVLVATATANLNSSLEVSMQEQVVQGGIGNQILYSYKYGRELNLTLESAEYKLEYFAINTGTKITEGLKDIYKFQECVTLTSGVGVVAETPVGDVAVELANGTIVTVTPTGKSIDLTDKGVSENAYVKVTYQYKRFAKQLVIDAETSPEIFEVVLIADRHNSKTGKNGHIEINVPSFSSSGNFTLSLTPDGVASQSIEGKAIKSDTDTCTDGSSVYAYITEYDDNTASAVVADICAKPSSINLAVGETKTISVIGIKGGLFSNIELENSDCLFDVDGGDTSIITVGADTGIVEAVSAGTAYVNVTYDTIYKDVVKVVVE